jgi:hypothetical protein
MKASSTIPTAMETAPTIAASSVEAASPAAVETTTTPTTVTAAMLGERGDRQTNE